MNTGHHWPSLEYEDWKNTYETLHRWVQIVGKIRTCKMPCMNHSWHCALAISSKGFTTLAIPDGERNFTIEMDFVNHELTIFTSTGSNTSFKLRNESVKSFYKRISQALTTLHIKAYPGIHPNETEDDTPFNEDSVHNTYVPHKAHRCWQVMVRVNNVLLKFRSQFAGKASPVHFFWGSFDLATTRFSGRKAPEHPAGFPHISDLVVKEAYSHEVSSCGFWPGNAYYPHAAFYSYAYPVPEGFSKGMIEPLEAFYHKDLNEFILPYDVVRKSADPEKMILQFFESTFQLAAILLNWNRVEANGFEESSFLKLIKEQNELKAGVHTPAQQSVLY
jgi:hypothetical protein